MMAIILICATLVTIGFLIFIVVKSVVVPKQLSGIKKLIKQGKTTAAIKAAKMMIAKKPNDFKAHYALAQAYLAEKKPELALMELKIVNQNAIFDDGDVNEIEFRKQIGQLYTKFNQPEEALKEYLLLTKLEPNNHENYLNCAKIFEQRNKPEHAMSYYQRTIKLSPRNVTAHAALALIFYRGKNIQEAKREIDLAIRLSPETFSSYYYLGKILKDSKDYSAAVNAFEKAIRDPEYRTKSLIERGSCYIAVNEIERAAAEYDRAIKSSKNENSQEILYARYFLASCFEKMRKIDQAIEQWEKIYEKNKSFKDVTAKLSDYRQVQTSDSMKEYLTSSAEQFVEICKKILLQVYNLSPTNITQTKSGCTMVATPAKSDNWMNMRQQVFMLIFLRDPETVEEPIIRKATDELKAKNIFKLMVFTSSTFSSGVKKFVENRPVELYDKDKLVDILSKIKF
ncbi:MAG: tetratricopeptide repeat protein [Treponemataceae bacterium]